MASSERAFTIQDLITISDDIFKGSKTLTGIIRVFNKRYAGPDKYQVDYAKKLSPHIHSHISCVGASLMLERTISRKLPQYQRIFLVK